MRVGVLGGGQLARMLALAGRPLGLEFTFLCPDPNACAAPLGEHLCAPFADAAALERLAATCDVVTYEFENAPLESVRILSERVPVLPSGAALGAAQDRLEEKTLFRRLGIDTPTFVPVASLEELQAAVEVTGYPALLKTRRLGYDGKGQALVRSAEGLAPAWEAVHGAAAILEAFVPFEREISMLAVRGRSGETVFYPVSENVHRNGILRLSTSRPDDPMQGPARDYARRLLDELDYTGVLALELFQAGGRLLANEMAPRVHNSGHWTIEGAECSQFENQLRAVLGWPLGATTPVGFAAMVNFIGAMPEASQVLALPNVHLHAYAKAPRAGRKLGHATVRSDDARALEDTSALLLRLADTAGEG